MIEETEERSHIGTVLLPLCKYFSLSGLLVVFHNFLQLFIDIMHPGSCAFTFPYKNKIAVLLSITRFVHLNHQPSERFPVNPLEVVPCNCCSGFLTYCKAYSMGMGSVFFNKQYKVPAGKLIPPGKDFFELERFC